MKQEIFYEQIARSKQMEGVDTMANAVKVTLGPKGRNVVLKTKWGKPRATKDGVTVARHINPADPFVAVGAQMLKEVAEKTAKIAGDGTTTATILAQIIIQAGLKLVAAGANPMEIKKGIDKAVAYVVANLSKLSTPVITKSALIQVAIISANNDESIGKLVGEIIHRIGKDGVVNIEESQSSETTTRTVDGLMIQRGFISPYMVTDPNKMEVELEEPFILVVDKKINNFKDMQKILSEVIKTGKSILLVADDVSGEALASMIVNKLQGSLKIAAVRTPFGPNRMDMMSDIALITGGAVITDSAGLKLDNINLTHLGHADKVVITKDSTTIIGGKGKKREIDSRVALLKKEDDQWSKERVAKLIGGVAIISVGAPTEVEMNENKDRIDDAVRACTAALKEGVGPGGGIALIRATKGLGYLHADNDDQLAGIKLIAKAVETPLIQMCRNGGEDHSEILMQVKKSKGNHGYNFKTGKMEDLKRSGIIDPTMVSRVALQSAASISSMILTSDCMIVDVAEPGDDQ